jgi:enamine deaminase RidA (YjgF/YER057c/UK114 family)
VPFVATGNLVFVSGQLPFENGQLRHKGFEGDDCGECGTR